MVELMVAWDLEARVQAFVKQGVSKALINEIDNDHDGTITRLEFLSYMLVHTGKIASDDVDEIMQIFDEYDHDGSDRICEKDIPEKPVSKEEKKSACCGCL